MTLNQILRRLKTIALAHNQIRRFKTGLVGDLFADHTAKYMACCLQYTGGLLAITGGAVGINFRMFVLDLVHVSQDTKENEDDVLSDTLSVIMDLVTQINNGNYNDWKITLDSNFTAVVEHENDMCAGWYIDFTIRTPFTQNVCQIPSDLVIDPNPGDMADKLVYDLKYIATGIEGNSLPTDGTIPQLAILNGKKLLFITREMSPIYKTSSNPDPAEYVWDNVDVLLGTITNPGERFLFLYRNY